MNAILEVRNLVKHYPGVTAVDGISLSIQTGICFGLLGPNGAGKTTAIEIIEGIIAPTSGEILYKGKPRETGFYEEIGIQFQSTALMSLLTVRETLETFRNLYRKTMSMEELIEMCRLEDILERDHEKISGGQKQRLLIAVALANDPELIFLDEPTTGLDPQSRRHLWNIVENIKAHGKTLVLTTHYMEEAQILCDEIAIIDNGKIITQGSPGDLLHEHFAGLSIICLPKENFNEPPERFFARDSGHPLVRNITDRQKNYEIQTDRTEECLRILLESGMDLSRMIVRSQNLDDLFLKLTGRNLRE